MAARRGAPTACSATTSCASSATGRAPCSSRTSHRPPWALYGHICASTIARAHARPGDRIALAAYLGRSDAFDQAVAKFAEAYADQNERDYGAVVRAEKDGRMAVQRNL